MSPIPHGQGPTAVSAAETSSQPYPRDDAQDDASSRAVVHLGTGEVIVDLTAQEPETLAEALLLLRERAAELRRMGQLVEAELKERMADRRPGAAWPVGEFELKRVNEAEWDAAELEGVLRDLLERGELTVRDIEGVFRQKVEVSRSTMNRLLDRLSGPAHEAVKRCRTWRARGVRVDRAISLFPPQD